MNNLLNKLRRTFRKNWEPQFLILGAQKAGTTTLYDILNRQKDFCGSLDKETGFFVNDVFYNQGNEWYSKQFEHGSSRAIKFEATPSYLYHPNVPKRIFSFSSNMKFIVVLREPASRCYSAWNMYRRFNESSANQIYEQFIQHSNDDNKNAISHLLFTKHYPSFREAVDDDIERYSAQSNDVEPSFVRCGIYVEQIERYLKFFNLKNFLFLEQRELNLPAVLAQKISDFFNITIDASAMNNPILSNIGDYPEYSIQDQKTLMMLRAFYKPHNEKLFNLIGMSYDWDEKVVLN